MIMNGVVSDATESATSDSVKPGAIATTRRIRGSERSALLLRKNAASTPQLARVVVQGQTDFDQLSDEERQQFIVWAFSWFRTIELAHHNYVVGNLDSTIWDGHARHLESVLQSPGIQRWWRLRESVFSPAFQEFVNGLDGDYPSISSVGKLFEELRPRGPAA